MRLSGRQRAFLHPKALSSISSTGEKESKRGMCLKLQVLQKVGPSAGSAWLLTRSLPDSSVTGCAAEGKQDG